MAHCTKCGAALPEGAGFCGACGTPQAAAPAGGGAAAAAAPSAPAESQMAENLAALLSYLVGWITGLIFYFIDKRPYVRFHAAQSIVVFGGLLVIDIVLMILGAVLAFAGAVAVTGILYVLIWVLDIAAFILWIILMIKAYQGQRFRVPIAADIAQSIFKP